MLSSAVSRSLTIPLKEGLYTLSTSQRRVSVCHQVFTTGRRYDPVGIKRVYEGCVGSCGDSGGRGGCRGVCQGGSTHRMEAEELGRVLVTPSVRAPRRGQRT